MVELERYKSPYPLWTFCDKDEYKFLISVGITIISTMFVAHAAILACSGMFKLEGCYHERNADNR